MTETIDSNSDDDDSADDDLLNVIGPARALPDHFDVCSLRGVLTGGFVGAGVNAFPKLMGGAFENHGDCELLPCRLPCF